MVISGVKGLVKDENNNSLSDAIVIIKGRELVPFTTSQRGEYWKLLLPGSYTLLVRVGVCVYRGGSSCSGHHRVRKLYLKLILEHIDFLRRRLLIQYIHLLRRRLLI